MVVVFVLRSKMYTTGIHQERDPYTEWLGSIGQDLYTYVLSQSNLKTSATHVFNRVQGIVWDTLELQDSTDVTLEMINGVKDKIQRVSTRNENASVRRAATLILDFLRTRGTQVRLTHY